MEETEPKIILLFLTGKRLAYVNDILTVLYLPKGAAHILKYKYIVSETAGSIVDASAVPAQCRAGDEVLIFYYDITRENKEKFIPLRQGKLLSCIYADGQLYYRVQLGDFCHAAYPDTRDLDEKILSILYPKDREQNPSLCLAVRSEHWYRFSPNYIEYTEDSWILTVNRMATTVRFEQYYTVFAKISVFRDRDGKEEFCTEDGYHLRVGKVYQMVLTYYVPHFNEHPFDVVEFFVSDAMKYCGIPEGPHLLASEQNRLELHFRPTKVEENSQTSISLNISQKKLYGKEIHYPRGMIPFSVEGAISSRRKTMYLVLLVCGMSLTNYIAQFPYAGKLEELYETVQAGARLSGYQEILLRICETYEQYAEGIVGIASVLATLLTLGLVKLIGKPKV